MSTLAMEYGSSGRVNTAGTGLKLAAKGEITDASVIDFIFDPGGQYLLFSNEFNASTGAYRGHRAIVISVPEESLYGTTAVTRGNAYASSNSGITITNNNDSTVSISRSSATYAVRYALYKVF